MTEPDPAQERQRTEIARNRGWRFLTYESMGKAGIILTGIPPEVPERLGIHPSRFTPWPVPTLAAFRAEMETEYVQVLFP